MSLVYVQFSDESEQVVVASFSSPQDESTWPNQGVIDASDERWHEYYFSLPEFFRLGMPVPD